MAQYDHCSTTLPMFSSGTSELLSRIYRVVTMGTFPVFTQRSNCHFITRRFTNLCISRHHRVSPVYFELTIILGSSPISLFLHLSRILISRYLNLCQGFTRGTFPPLVSAPVLAN